MKEPDWRSDLDAVLGSIERLNDSLRAIDRHESIAVSDQLRAANKKLWRMVNELEASNKEYIWDVGAILEAIEESHPDIVATFVTLVDAKALRINHQALIDAARDYGVDPDDYLSSPHPREGDK